MVTTGFQANAHTHAYLKIFWAFDIFFNTAIHLKQNTFCEV